MDTQTNGDVGQMPQPRLLPYVVSDHAKRNPQKIWAALPRSPSDASEGYEDITFARLNYAISRAATWLVDIFEDKITREFEEIAYVGPPDSRYVIFAIAAIKAGFQMLFLSPRNSDEAQYSVLLQAKCQKFVCATSMKDRIEKLVRNRPDFSNMTVDVAPEQEELLRDQPVPEFPYEKTLEEARQEPLVTLHTSSTTGMPKTIPLNQGYGLHEDIVQHIPNFNGLDIITRKPFRGKCRMFVAMPLFHAGGVLLTLLKSLYHDIVSVFQPSSVPLNAEVFDAILRYGNCNGCVIPPSLLEDMLAIPAFFDTLSSLKFVQFGSGPLSKACGDTLLTRQSDCPHYIGSSECGLYILLELDDPVRDWQYFRFHPWSGADFRPSGTEDNVKELFIVRSDNKMPGVQPVFELFPELEEWPTRELYIQHPTKPDQWRFIGRNDDVLVLSNGEKLNPIETESRIANAHPAVSGAIVIGQGRFMPGLLLEIRDIDTRDPKARAKLVDEIWPTVEQANLEAPTHGQLTKSLILFTSPEKPFSRTPKLSVRRSPTIDLYAHEIDDMYHRLETNTEASVDVTLPSNVDLASIPAIQDSVMDLMNQLTGWETKPDLDDDLFMLGLDSLHVSRLVRAIKQLFSRANPTRDAGEVTSRMVYGNPTIRKLSQSLHELVKPKAGNGVAGDESTREREIESLISEYTDFDFNFDSNIKTEEALNSGRTELKVILTGSTGSLGSYLLSALLKNPHVANIYCLNRAQNARTRQLASLSTQNLSKSALSKFETNVHFHHTNDLFMPSLGLPEQDAYSSLKNTGITHIIHNAWPVNFNLSLVSFKSHVAGVRALIDFCASVPSRPHLYFVSSLSSVTSLSARSRVPEAIVFNPSAPSHMGYGESKYCAERILGAAKVESEGEISTTVLRVGQIAGPINSEGIWPTREWLPSLVISSKCIEALPEILGRMEMVDWIPVDVLADIIHELAFPDMEDDVGERSASRGTRVYHLLNPNSVSWHKTLLPTVKKQIHVEKVVPLSEWIRLVNDGPNAERSNPAKKILGFYEALDRQSQTEDNATAGNKRYDTTDAMKHSKILGAMGPVTKEWMEVWTGKWLES